MTPFLWLVSAAGVVMYVVVQRRAVAINRRERNRLSGSEERDFLAAVATAPVVAAAAPGPDRSQPTPRVDDDLGRRIRRALGGSWPPRTKHSTTSASGRRRGSRPAKERS